MLFAEDVAHSTARDDFEPTATLPNSKGNFEVLTTPNIHLHIISPQLVEIFAVYNKQAASDHWCPEIKTIIRGCSSVLSFLNLHDCLSWIVFSLVALFDGQKLPFENQIPVEAASQLGGSGYVIKIFHTNHVNNWTNDPGAILLNI